MTEELAKLRDLVRYLREWFESQPCHCRDIGRLYPNSKQKLCGRCAMLNKIDTGLGVMAALDSVKGES